MGLPEPQRFFVEDLCARWGATPEYILEVGISGQLIIWAEFSHKFAVPETYLLLSPKEQSRKYPDVEGPFMIPTRFSFAKIETRPLALELSKLRLEGGEVVVMCVHCVHGPPNAHISVATGTQEPFVFSMKNLFVKLEDVKAFETKHGIDVNQDNEPPPPAQLPAKREGTLLKVIGALLTMKYQDQSYFKGNGEVNADHMARQFNIDLAEAGFTDDGLKSDTIRRTVLKQAFEAIAENRRE